MCDQNPQDVDPNNNVVDKAITPENDSPIQTTIQPFQKCAKRDEWDNKYQQEWLMDIEKEKQILREKKKAPRKPLSPYIFFSQEKRKEIKKSEEGHNLTAKQIMKMVSKRWQEMKDDKSATERYEYMSIRDREAYSDLRIYWDQIREEISMNDQKQGDGGNPDEHAAKRSNRGMNKFNRDIINSSLRPNNYNNLQQQKSSERRQASPDHGLSENQISNGIDNVGQQKILPKKRGRKKMSDCSATEKTNSPKPRKRQNKMNLKEDQQIKGISLMPIQQKSLTKCPFNKNFPIAGQEQANQFPSGKERSVSMDNYAFYQNNLTSAAASFPNPCQPPLQQLAIPNFDRKLTTIDEIKELKSECNEITDLEDHAPTKNTNGSQLNQKRTSIDQNMFKGFDYDHEQVNHHVNRALQQNEATQKILNNINHGFDHQFQLPQISSQHQQILNANVPQLATVAVMKPPEMVQNHQTQQVQAPPLTMNNQYSFQQDQNASLLTPLRNQEDSGEPNSGPQPEAMVMRPFQSSLYKLNPFENERPNLNNQDITNIDNNGADQQSAQIENQPQMNFASQNQQQLELAKMQQYEHHQNSMLDIKKWFILNQNQGSNSINFNQNNQSSQ